MLFRKEAFRKSGEKGFHWDFSAAVSLFVGPFPAGTADGQTAKA